MIQRPNNSSCSDGTPVLYSVKIQGPKLSRKDHDHSFWGYSQVVKSE